MSSIYKNHLEQLSGVNIVPNNVEVAINRLVCDPDELSLPLSKKEMEDEILKLDGEIIQVSILRKRGMPMYKIADKLNISVKKAQSMYEKYLTYSFKIAPKDADLLRQEILDQIDAGIEALFLEADITSATGTITTAQMSAYIALLDRKVKLLGVQAPERVDINVIDQTHSSLEKINQYIRNLNKNHTIDVTPK